MAQCGLIMLNPQEGSLVLKMGLPRQRRRCGAAATWRMVILHHPTGCDIFGFHGILPTQLTLEAIMGVFKNAVEHPLDIRNKHSHIYLFHPALSSGWGYIEYSNRQPWVNPQSFATCPLSCPNFWMPDCHCMSLLLRIFLGGSLASSEARKPTTSRWPRSNATSKAVAPLWVVLSISEQDSSNNWITRRCPSCAARCKAVDPSSVVGWSLLAPHSMREWTMSRWPWWAARCTGEKTSPVSAAFLSAPASSNRRTGSTCPSNAAWCRGWRSTSSPRMWVISPWHFGLHRPELKTLLYGMLILHWECK